MKRLSILFTVLACAVALSSCCNKATTDPTADWDLVDYVNPLTGTLSTGSFSTGNTYPAIARPWGMNFWTPVTSNRLTDGWAYTYQSTHIRGFKQTHQPSPWMNDYGQFSILPMTSEDGEGSLKLDISERGSWFSHKAETAKPHYYSVYLADYDVVTEITPTERAAIFRFTFPETDNSYVLVDAFDRGSYIKVIPEENKIIGYTVRNSGGVAENFKNYFVIVFDKPFEYKKTFGVEAPAPVQRGQQQQRPQQMMMQRPVPDINAGILSEELEQQKFHNGAVIGFKTKKGEKVQAKVASSFISFEQAELNMKELGNDSFEKVKQDGRDIWNDVLGRIVVEGGNLDQTRTFYSCLYRSLLFPRRFYEYNAAGEVVHYSPYTGEVVPGYFYTDTGFWDTFRALFPLLNLAYADENIKMQEGLINTYKESNFFPEWNSPGHRGIMVGNNSASVLADAYLKGHKIEDTETLWEGLVHGTQNVHPRSSATGRLGHEWYNTLGYVPYDSVGVNANGRARKINENAARTLEYAYDDWCIYQLGKALGRPEAELEVYKQRALNYKNLYDAETKLMRGKNLDGTFQSPFNPLKWGDAFTEGNSWHYTWSVFHDPQGLIDLMGGDAEFITMLDSVFSVPPLFDDSYYGGVIHEIREMQVANMGNYAHGNQPIQHMIYLYNYAREPWKAQYWVRETMNRMYNPWADGYCGDEDNGQTSAWYVFSAMGFYPVAPGTNQYILGAPLFQKVTITMDNGKKFVITAPKNSDENRYIQSMTINGKNWTKNYIEYETIRKGGKMNFVMGSEPNTKRGTGDADRPYSFTFELQAE